MRVPEQRQESNVMNAAPVNAAPANAAPVNAPLENSRSHLFTEKPATVDAPVDNKLFLSVFEC